MKGSVEVTPAELQAIQVTEHLGTVLDGELELTDEDGKTVKLGSYFDGKRPVILTLVYYNCPMLCSMVVNGLVGGMRDLKWAADKDYRVVTISIDPRETPELAKAKKANYLKMLGRTDAAEGWKFHVAKPEVITKITKALGFGYRYDPDTTQYAHGAVIFAVSPKAKVTRYLYGIQFPEKQLRLALTGKPRGTGQGHHQQQ